MTGHLVGGKDVARVVDDRIDQAVGAGIAVGSGADAPQDTEREQDVLGEPGSARSSSGRSVTSPAVTPGRRRALRS
ncbi:hypothetical protein OG830_05770 [Streptomyces sp. NBC_00121]|uniref:hypothetical protein n=1 Tax=unclassified Streptomyces TaxID=2593676 RepID=UPI002DDA29E3|nr:hypothetical protein [Streptomyces sp. NBC_01760]WSC67981.1 hypothetical protein OG807_05790 [Streptomyces sp. NBC_01760]